MCWALFAFQRCWRVELIMLSFDWLFKHSVHPCDICMCVFTKSSFLCTRMGILLHVQLLCINEARAYLSTILKLMIWTLDLSDWPSDRFASSYCEFPMIYQPCCILPQGMLCVLYFCIRPITWYLIVPKPLPGSLLCKLISVFTINFSLNVYDAHICIACLHSI